MLKKIKETIVVEGKNDTVTLKRYFDCDTIETGGSSIDDEVIERIRAVQKDKGVIVFTDPDAPGMKIRTVINQAVPGCKNAFIDKKVARTDKKVGVEHASKKDLEAALASLLTYDENYVVSLTMQELVELGLNGQGDSAALREKVALYYPVGKCNAKQLLKRLNMLGVNKEMLERVLYGE